MPIKLSNSSYSFSDGGIISVTAIINILSDDGAVVVYQSGISANAHIGGKWLEELTASLKDQARAIIGGYERAMALVKEEYPTAMSPEEALTQFMAGVQAAILEG